VTNIRHTKFRKFEKPGLTQEPVDIMGYISFLSKMHIRILLPRRNAFLYSS